MCNLEFCDGLSLVLSWPALACSPLRLLPFSPAEARCRRGSCVGRPRVDHGRRSDHRGKSDRSPAPARPELSGIYRLKRVFVGIGDVETRGRRGTGLSPAMANARRLRNRYKVAVTRWVVDPPTAQPTHGEATPNAFRVRPNPPDSPWVDLLDRPSPPST
jgi:hypothetical protein